MSNVCAPLVMDIAMWLLEGRPLARKKVRAGGASAEMTQTTIVLTREQHRWLREEAMRRVKGSEKPDASAIIREWIERARRRRRS